MNWYLTLDNKGVESGSYRIRPHAKCRGRWVAAMQPYVKGMGLGQNQRVVLGGFSSLQDAKKACERHSSGLPIFENGKPCRLCGEHKPLSDYHSEPNCKDNHKTACKKCLNQRQYEKRKKCLTTSTIA